MHIRRIVTVALCFTMVGVHGLLTPASGQETSTTSNPAYAAAAPSRGVGDLNPDMKLEDLARQDVVVPALSTPVTTVERQASTVGRSPAAVFVITPEMIRRSGARTIPDVLRMAPGVDVARIDAHTWAISARGFNGRYANKLLVQIDGRVVYNASFGGVYWDMQDVVLEDIERIEVIRGPGTTMWGSNAVNGVINIITKRAGDTQGVLVQSGGGGQDQQDFNTLRYGSGNGNGMNWRVWGQQFDQAPGWSNSGVDDAWNMQHGGFRMDYTPNKVETLTVQGDLENGRGGQRSLIASPAPPFDTLNNNPAQFPDGNILMRYGQVCDQETSWQIQTYYDRYAHNVPGLWSEERETYDIDLQYNFSPWDGHQFVTGVNYRNSPETNQKTFFVGFSPPSFDTQWASWYIQDTIALEPDRWYLTLGVRLEYNTFGGFEPEPTVRLLFLPTERQSMWAAISRAVRNPMRVDTQLEENLHVGPPNVPVFSQVLGNPDFKPEDVVAYEIGYRAAPTDTFSWDIAGYINDYNRLIGLGPVGAPVFVPPGYLFFPVTLENNGRAVSYGCELTATYQMTPRWRWFTSYSLFEVHAETAGAPDLVLQGSSPHNQLWLQSSMDIGCNWKFDVIGRYVDRLTALDVPNYFEMDVRLAWQASRNMEISFVGQNLMDSHHLEFQDQFTGLVATEVRRSWYGMLTWKY